MAITVVRDCQSDGSDISITAQKTVIVTLIYQCL